MGFPSSIGPGRRRGERRQPSLHTLHSLYSAAALSHPWQDTTSQLVAVSARLPIGRREAGRVQGSGAGRPSARTTPHRQFSARPHLTLHLLPHTDNCDTCNIADRTYSRCFASTAD